MSSKRRKQQQPRHIIQDPFLLTHTLENEISCDYDTTTLIRSYDNHICGRCCAEFYTMPAFLLHKRHCTNEWPVIFSTEDEEKSSNRKDYDDFNDSLTNNNKNCINDRVINDNDINTNDVVNPANVAQIQTALASLQRQQLVQLQLIQQIYSQLLGEKTTTTNGDDISPVLTTETDAYETTTTSATDLDSLKIQVMSSLKEMEQNVTQQINEQRKADSCLDRLYRNKCQLCGKVVSNVEQLQNHLRTMHSEELNLPYACKKCPARFASRDELKDHIEEIHRKLDDDAAFDADVGGNEEIRPKSYPNSFFNVSSSIDDGNGAKSDPGTYRLYKSTSNNSELSTISSPENSIDTGNDDLTNSGRSRTATPNGDYVGGPNSVTSFVGICESSPLDLSTNPSASLQTVIKQQPPPPPSLPNQNSSSTSNVAETMKFDPFMIFPNFSASSNRSKTPTGDADDDWESLMEIQNTDEAAKIRQLVGDRETKVTDPNQCMICHRILSCKSALQMHYRTHTGTRPFKCKVCQRAFTTKGNLKTHMGVHRTKPPFRLFHQCPVCHKRFTNGLVLQQHIRLHIGQPLEISLEQIHAAEIKEPDSGSNSPSPPTQPQSPIRTNGSVGCTLPNVLLSSPILVGNEKRVKENHDRNTESGGDTSTPTSTPINDINRRAFSFSPAANCQFPIESPSPAALQLHSPLPLPGSNPYSAVMGPTPHQMAMMSGRPSTTCNICFKTFACYSALEIHYRSHTKERPFKCDVCGRGFSTKGNMKQHLLTHKIRDLPPKSNNSNNSFDRTNDESERDSSHSSPSQPFGATKSEEGRSDSVNENGDSSASASTKFVQQQQPQQCNSFADVGDILLADEAIRGEERNGMSSNGPTPLESIQKMWAKTETLASVAGDSTSNASKKQPIFNKHQCQLCYKNFSSASALQIHMRTHTGDRPFSCKICSRAFTTKGNLKVHMGTHMWTNTNRRGRRIFDVPTNAVGLVHPAPSKSADISDDDETNDSKCVTISTSKNGDVDESKTLVNSFHFRDVVDELSKSKTAVNSNLTNSSFTLPSFCSPNTNAAILSQLPRQQPSTTSTNFSHLDSMPPALGPHLIPNPFSTSFAAGFSPYSASPLSQINPFAHAAAMNGRPTSADSSMEAMLLMWRTVCSVCHKVCASASELEDHLKHHLGQVGVDRKTPLQT